MNDVRYILGVLLVVSLPPAVAYWFVVHPLARRWRRVDVRVTFGVLTLVMLGGAALLFMIRGTLLGSDLGTSRALIGIGAACYLAAIVLTLRVRRHLSFRILAGVPEVSEAAYPGRLLQEGVYGVIRHPRYLAVVLGAVGMALVANYLGVYLVMVVSLLGLVPLVRMEERELAARFGPAYAEYRARVPALFPKLRTPAG